MTDLDQLMDLLGRPGDGVRFYGLTVGVVTNNQDPDKMGRVKVRFPWLSDVEESAWARVVTPMAGKERGLYLLPEVEDEVLVGFEHGRAEFPYVLGALWNGKNRPPVGNDEGKNNLRVLRSRSGHLVRLDDTAGAEKIEIVDATAKNSIVIDTAANTITVTGESDVTIASANGKLVLSGTGIELRSKADVTIEASGKAELKASGPTTVKGSVVNIN